MFTLLISFTLASFELGRVLLRAALIVVLPRILIISSGLFLLTVQKVMHLSKIELKQLVKTNLMLFDVLNVREWEGKEDEWGC